MDVIVTCFSAYYDDHQGILVINNKRIMIKYLKGWFSVDLIASLPINLIEDAFNVTSHSQYIKILRFLRLPRLHRLVEISKLG